MRNNSGNKKTSLWLCSKGRVLLAIFCAVAISACSGGISGTGDGRPPIIIPPEGSIDSTNGGAGGESNGDAVMQQPTDSARPLADLYLLIPETLLQLTARNENISSTQPLAAQLRLLQQELAATLATTDNAASTTEAPSDNFDYTISTFETGIETVIAGTNTNTLTYIFSSNADRAIHLLQEGNVLTIRRVDRNSNTMLQANIYSLTDGSSVIEADLNQNGSQSYIQTFNTSSHTAAFSQHPTDRAVPLQRELVDITGAVSVIQTCTAASLDCSSEENWTNSNDNASSKFTSALLQINTTLAANSSAFNELPNGVNEAVLVADVTADGQPVERQIQCGIQRVNENIITFCLRALPIAPEGILFSESLAGGEVFYQLLR